MFIFNVYVGSSLCWGIKSKHGVRSFAFALVVIVIRVYDSCSMAGIDIS
jgi:hypothetical protein